MSLLTMSDQAPRVVMRATSLHGLRGEWKVKTARCARLIDLHGTFRLYGIDYVHPGQTVPSEASITAALHAGTLPPGGFVTAADAAAAPRW